MRALCLGWWTPEHLGPRPCVSHLQVGDDILKVIQLQQLCLALRNHRQRRLRADSRHSSLCTQFLPEPRLDPEGWHAVALVITLKHFQHKNHDASRTGRMGVDLRQASRDVLNCKAQNGCSTACKRQILGHKSRKLGRACSRIPEWPSSRMMSMMRAEKAEGKGHANSVRNHWLAYSTGATVFTCR